MFAWLSSLVSRNRQTPRDGLVAHLRELNAKARGGKPTTEERSLGTLEIPSLSLAMCDPQGVASPLIVENAACSTARISARLWVYPSGAIQVKGIGIRFIDCNSPLETRQVGRLGIDSAKLIVADALQLQTHWAESGPARIGKISIAPDDQVLNLLVRQFGLRIGKRNVSSVEVVEPVSEALESNIETYLRTFPEYADFPFLHFHVQTNDSFDRVNYLKDPFAFVQIGNDPNPLMFVCETGDGDGTYDVVAEYDRDRVAALSVTFIDED